MKKFVPSPIPFLFAAFFAIPEPGHSQHFQVLLASEDDLWGTGSWEPVNTTDGGVLTSLTTDGVRSLLKVDLNGTPMWNREYPAVPGETWSWSDKQPTADGGAFLLRSGAIVQNIGNLIVTRIASDGSAVWSKRYDLPLAPNTGSGGVAPLGLVRANGGMDVLILMDISGPKEYFLMRLDQDGDVEWVRRSPIEVALSAQPASAIFLHDDLDGLRILQPTTGQNAGLISNMDAQGQHVWGRTVKMTNALWEYSSTCMAISDPGELYVFGDQSTFTEEANYLFKLSATGDLEWYRWLDMGWPPLGVYSHVGRVADGAVQFGGRTRLSFSLDGVLQSASEVSMPTLVNNPYEIALLPNVPFDPQDDLLIAGNLRREDVTFGYQWNWPVLMRVPLDLSNSLTWR